MNHKILVTTVFLLNILLSINAQKNTLKWQSSPLEIDGNSNDWISENQILRFSNSESQIKFEFRNDSSNLYFIFKYDDRSLQQQITMSGMNLKFIIKEKEKRKSSIIFREKSKGIEPPVQQNQTMTLDKYAIRKDFLPKDTAFLEGFTSQGYVISGDSSFNGICFELSKVQKENETTFELRLPLRELFNDGYNLSKICQIPIQLQLAINAPSVKSGQGEMKSHGGMGGRPPGGGGGAPGGGNLGGGAPPDMNGGGMGGENRPTPDQMQKLNSMSKKSFNFEFYLTNK